MVSGKVLYFLFITFCSFNENDCSNGPISIAPSTEFHDRSKYLIVTCNGSSVTNNVTMYFDYYGERYTVPSIHDYHGVYIGNFSIMTSDQSKVLIICVDLNNQSMFTEKLYLFGYPPSFISQQFKIDLKCRDFNYERVVCHLVPNVSYIEQSLGFEGNRKSGFQVKLMYSQTESVLLTPNESTFDLSYIILLPTMELQIVIQNILGIDKYQYTFDRLAIQKPDKPAIVIAQLGKTNFTFSANFVDFGEYNVNGSCKSLTPIIMSKQIEFQMFGLNSNKIVSDHWPQNAQIRCTFAAYVLFGKDTVGTGSDHASIEVTLLEGIPNAGPPLSSLFVDYNSLTDNGFLVNVIVYYMNVPLVDRNGVIVQYKWRCDNCFYKKRNASNIIHTLPADSRSFKLDRSLLASVLSLTACTKVGCSDIWTRLHLKPLKDITSTRRLSIIRNSFTPSGLTLIWHNDNALKNDLILLVCTISLGANECSSIEQFTLPSNVTRINNFFIRKDIKVKFALLSFGNDSNYKLKWIQCVYNSIPVYEFEQKLQELPYSTYANWTVKCTFLECYASFKVRIPQCDKMPDMFFDSLYVTYKSSDGDSDIRIPVTSDHVRFKLSNLSPGLKQFKFSIHAVNAANKSVLWFHSTLTTDFWCASYVCITVALIMMLFIIICVMLYLLRNKIGKDYFEKKFVHRNNVPTSFQNNDLVKNDQRCESVILLNAEHKEYSYTGAQDVYDMNDNQSELSQEVESTFSTPVDYTDSCSMSVEGETDKSVNDTLSYVLRPNMDINEYAQIACPSQKEDIISLISIKCPNSVVV